LFTFNIKDPRLVDLAGVSVEEAATAVVGQKLSEQGPLLVTHWGLSGPAILKLSAWGARALSECGYRFKLRVNWAPKFNPETARAALDRLPEAGRRAVHGVIELQDLAVATSGDYRCYLQVGDARLAHSMDSRRSAPVKNAVASVTVLARSCMHADAWATALLVAGPGEGLAMAQRMGLEALFLLRAAEGLVEMGLGRFGSSSASAGIEASLDGQPRAVG